MDPKQFQSDLEVKVGGLLAGAFKLAVAKLEHSAPEAFAAYQVHTCKASKNG